MAVFRRGSKGPEVARLQARLSELGFDPGPADGIFGGATESAVRTFQKSESLAPDGLAGPQTLNALFGDAPVPEPAILSAPLETRSLALTGSFENSLPVPQCFSGLSGDFDGQGISFGALQWNIGQDSLQPLLRQMDQTHRAVVDRIFGPHAGELRAMLDDTHDEQMAWARSKQNARHAMSEPWSGLFKTLGRAPEYQAIQTEAAQGLYDAGLELCGRFALRSQRAAALMFDIKVQNGSISGTVAAQIEADFATLPGGLDRDDAEVARLRIVANRRAEASKPRWVEDVRTRKLTIANGHGTVHGDHYNLAEDYGIGLEAVAGP